MKIAIYSRKSKFTGKGESIENQILLCKEYAKKHFDVDDILIYEDQGFSGGNIDRPEYQRMLKDAKKNKFNILICYRLDRISRNVSDFSSTLEILQEHNISFVSLREQFDTSTPMGRAMVYIASVFAQLERETIAERVKDNMMELAKTGRWLGGRTPFGFKSEPIKYYDHEMNKRKMYRLKAINKELNIVKQIYSKYLKLGTLTKVESWSLENNLKTRNNKYFDKSILKVILTNPVYAIADELLFDYFDKHNSYIANTKSEFNGSHSLMVYNKHDESKSKRVKRKDKSEWIVALAKHKGIIPSENWIRVQYLIENNSKKAPRAGTSSVGLLTGLLKCQSCGSTMRVAISKKPYGSYHYYKCLMKERSRGSVCNIKNLSGNIAEEMVINEIKKIAKKNSDYINELLNSFQEKDTDNYYKKNLEKQLKEYEKSIENLTIQLAQNEKSVAAKYIINQIEKIDDQIKEVKSRLYNTKEIEEATLFDGINIELLSSLIIDFANNVDKLKFNEKKKMIKQIVNGITWDGEKLQIDILNHGQS